ncbi:MAG: hypothetical protein SGPRY_014579 [Prymnesium sp.]
MPICPDHANAAKFMQLTSSKLTPSGRDPSHPPPGRESLTPRHIEGRTEAASVSKSLPPPQTLSGEGTDKPDELANPPEPKARGGGGGAGLLDRMVAALRGHKWERHKKESRKKEKRKHEKSKRHKEHKERRLEREEGGARKRRRKSRRKSSSGDTSSEADPREGGERGAEQGGVS